MTIEDDRLKHAQQLFEEECRARGVTIASDIRARWGVMFRGKGKPVTCDYAIGPKRDGQKPQAYLFEATYTYDGVLIDFSFPDGTDNKYFVPNPGTPDEE